MVGKGESVGQGVGVEVAVTVAAGVVGAGVDDGTGVAVTVAVAVTEGAIVEVADGVIKDTVVVAARTACVTVLPLLLASGSDTVQLAKLNITINNDIIDQRPIIKLFISLCNTQELWMSGIFVDGRCGIWLASLRDAVDSLTFQG
jgi:hypothetical protein